MNRPYEGVCYPALVYADKAMTSLVSHGAASGWMRVEGEAVQVVRVEERDLWIPAGLIGNQSLNQLLSTAA